MKNTLLLAVFLTANSAGMACSSVKSANDSWSGQDKQQHFAVSSMAGAFGAYLARDSKHPVLYGTLLGVTPGLIKELSDGCRSGGTGFSTKDMAYNLAGAFLGAQVGNLTINVTRAGRGDRGVSVGYHRRF